MFDSIQFPNKKGGYMKTTKARRCPKCKKLKECSVLAYLGATKYSFQRIDVPHYYCMDCKTIYLDSKQLKEIIRMWRNKKPYRPSIQNMYKEIVNIFKGMYFKNFTFIRFFKN